MQAVLDMYIISARLIVAQSLNLEYSMEGMVKQLERQETSEHGYLKS